MSFWTFVFLTVIAGMIYSGWRSKHFAQNGAYEENGEVKHFDGPREKALEREVEELRERVKVLERIATDGRETRLLADEIDKLRDN